jgi:hypothetical protein
LITESPIKHYLPELLPDTVNLSNILHGIGDDINGAPKKQNDCGAIQSLTFQILQ